ncbi:putative DCC family thiol-disulfide oxidoreductase YuxK [Sphingomonas zeicaulis]|uniref:DCC1-like thiol-disulfide oxidoreductase family protein n=1 Tax=Sphingomonas zeicaulis TaxID=1632740 RepID=UPI003D19EF6E
MSRPGVDIVYDGECPFCSAYVKMVRLREAAGPVRLVDARSDDPLVDEMRRRGFDLDQGMGMRIGDDYVHGDAVMQRIAMMSSPSGALNRVHAWIFRDARRAKLLYPPLRACRNATLRLLGRKPIGAGAA